MSNIQSKNVKDAIAYHLHNLKNQLIDLPAEEVRRGLDTDDSSVGRVVSNMQNAMVELFQGCDYIKDGRVYQLSDIVPERLRAMIINSTNEIIDLMSGSNSDSFPFTPVSEEEVVAAGIFKEIFGTPGEQPITPGCELRQGFVVSNPHNSGEVFVEGHINEGELVCKEPKDFVIHGSEEAKRQCIQQDQSHVPLKTVREQNDALKECIEKGGELKVENLSSPAGYSECEKIESEPAGSTYAEFSRSEGHVSINACAKPNTTFSQNTTNFIRTSCDFNISMPDSTPALVNSSNTSAVPISNEEPDFSPSDNTVAPNYTYVPNNYTSYSPISAYSPFSQQNTNLIIAFCSVGGVGFVLGAAAIADKCITGGKYTAKAINGAKWIGNTCDEGFKKSVDWVASCVRGTQEPQERAMEEGNNAFALQTFVPVQPVNYIATAVPSYIATTPVYYVPAEPSNFATVVQQPYATFVPVQAYTTLAQQPSDYATLAQSQTSNPLYR
ncbi:MAG: hypothetical protein K0R98_946 [Rickettsiaceae bacterium]|jgi:hypothetical protein|nr:hypothetical protein [Rickettsiaceae bacterium]